MFGVASATAQSEAATTSPTTTHMNGRYAMRGVIHALRVRWPQSLVGRIAFIP